MPGFNERNVLIVSPPLLLGLLLPSPGVVLKSSLEERTQNLPDSTGLVHPIRTYWTFVKAETLGLA